MAIFQPSAIASLNSWTTLLKKISFWQVSWHISSTNPSASTSSLIKAWTQWGHPWMRHTTILWDCTWTSLTSHCNNQSLIRMDTASKSFTTWTKFTKDAQFSCQTNTWPFWFNLPKNKVLWRISQLALFLTLWMISLRWIVRKCLTRLSFKKCCGL